MITILSIINDKNDLNILRKLFMKANIRFVPADPSYSNYLKAMQYDPHIVFMEVAQDPKNHLHFLQLIRNNRGIEQKPFILYGPPFGEKIVDLMKKMGADVYLTKPLDLKKLLDEIQTIMRTKVMEKGTFKDKNQLSEEESTALFEASVPKSKKIEIMRKHIDKLLAFPATVANVLRISQDDKSGARELAQVIKSDPSVSTEILKISNSVFYTRGSSKRILDIQEAIVRIGFIQTKNTAMSLNVFKILKERNYETGFNHIDFWFHSLGVAIIASRLAKHSQLVQEEEAFIGGLLHDLGILLFNEFFNGVFLTILDKTTSNGIPFISCQDSLLGFNHNDLTAQLFSEWNFPETLRQNALNFGCTANNLTARFCDERPLPVVINIAEIIAKCLQIGREADCCVEAIPNELFERLKMPFGLQSGFIDAIYTEMNMFNQVLKISNRKFPCPNNQIRNAEKVQLLSYSFTKEIFNPVVEYLKTQHYQVTTTSDQKTFAEKGPLHHAIIVTDGQGAVMGDITEFSGRKVRSFLKTMHEGIKEVDANPEGLSTGAKMIVFDSKKDITTAINNEQVVFTRYPVDLRNVDMVLACLLLEHPIDASIKTIGTLKPTGKTTIAGQSMASRQVLIAHNKSDIRKSFSDLFQDVEDVVLEETNEAQKALNMARTCKNELNLIILDLYITGLECAKVVKQIMELPNHKRVKFLVTFSKAEKEQLVPLIKLGVRFFINDTASKDTILKKLEEMQF